MDKKEKKGIISRFFWLIQHRPGHLYAVVRGYLLFYWARFIRTIINLNGVELGDNVRLQKNSSLMAESPKANISIGENSVVYEDARIEAYKNGQISIGASSIIGITHIVCRYRIDIGKRFLSSWNVFIQDYDSHPNTQWQRKLQVEHMIAAFKPCFSKQPQNNVSALDDWDFPGEAIVIGDDVWVGAGATILKGVTIGSGSIVATGAVVLRGSYPSHSLIAGNPAVVVKTLNQTNSKLSGIHDQDHANQRTSPL